MNEKYTVENVFELQSKPWLVVSLDREGPIQSNSTIAVFNQSTHRTHVMGSDQFRCGCFSGNPHRKLAIAVELTQENKDLIKRGSDVWFEENGIKE